MILAGNALREAAEKSLSPAPEPDTVSVDVHVPWDVVIEPHSFKVVDAVETLSLPTHLAATITGRSSHMRDGVTMPGGFVDPGFSGRFKLEFFNHSDRQYIVEAGEAGGRLVFFKLSEEADAYNGRWQA